MLKGNGVDFVKADGTVDLDSPEAVETVDWFAGFHTRHKVTQPSALADRAPEIYALYQSGKVAQMTHGLRTWKIFADAMGDKAAAFQFPRGKKSRLVPTGMNGSSVYTLSKSQDEGWALVAHLGEPETARPFSVERGSPPTLKSMENDAIYRENRFFKVASESGPAWGQLPSYHKNWAKLSDRWKPEMDRLLKQEINAEAFCKTMAGLLRS